LLGIGHYYFALTSARCLLATIASPASLKKERHHANPQRKPDRTF
jgi:hypothetical protein